MVVLNKIYTRTGDKGETGLGDGTRVPKYSIRVNSYGSVDETNATVGMARLYSHGSLDTKLAAIQNDLFDLDENGFGRKLFWTKIVLDEKCVLTK